MRPRALLGVWWALAALAVVVATSTHARARVSSNARVWLSQGTNYAWPESDLPVVRERANNGVCFPGGGNRAYTVSVGYLRALHELGWLEKIRYTTAISGGSWALSALNFRPQTNTTAFLGSCTRPEELTLDFLATAPERNTIGYAVPEGQSLSNLTDLFLSPEAPILLAELLLHPHNGSEFLWTQMVSEVYLESIGVQSRNPVAWNSTHAQQIIARNPHLANTSFVVPQPGLPFPIIIGTALGPLEAVPLSKNTEHNAFTSVDFTPLYAGGVFARNVTYRSKNNSTETIAVGGLVEQFAFGGRSLSPPLNVSSARPHAVGLANLTIAAAPFGVRDATAISSMALSSALCTDSEEARALSGVSLCDVAPRYDGLSMLDPNQRSMVLGDGGVLENTGVIALLRRGVDRIVVFDSGEQELRENANMQCLFGVGESSRINVGDGFYYAHNQVFDQVAYTTFLDILTFKIYSGKPAVASLNVTTVKNEYWGVPGGMAVQLTWIFLNAPTEWLNRLPQETQRAINNKTAGALFPNFPRYRTESQFFLTPSQFNLLAELTCHIVRESEAVLEVGLGLQAHPAGGRT